MDLLTTAEVAEYLRIKERKIYELVRQHAIPCARVTGKLVFPKQAIDRWILSHMAGDRDLAEVPPPVYAGSSDPLLEWALRESGSDLAILCHGSGDGVKRLLEGRAAVIGMHLIDADTGGFNEPRSTGLGGVKDLVMIAWAHRRQGLVVAPGNPLGIHGFGDILRSQARMGMRQPGAGADLLLRYLLTRAGQAPEAIAWLDRPALTEDDLAAEIQRGEADCGLAVEASARRHGLGFVPLFEERFDLAMRRRNYFEPAVQRLTALTREPRFRQRAAEMGGYDVSDCGKALYNA